jgi:hypothetical protein
MYDLIIVGGGLSAASAGRIAGKRGLSTLLIEKEKFPRYKSCGGALSSYAISCLDFKLTESVIERNISNVKILFRDGSVEVRKARNLAVLISRTVFDNIVLDNFMRVRRVSSLLFLQNFLPLAMEGKVTEDSCSDGIQLCVSKNNREIPDSLNPDFQLAPTRIRRFIHFP